MVSAMRLIEPTCRFDLPNRRLRPDIMTKTQAADAAQAFARAERDKIDSAK
jgi:hypothetical protein